MDRSKLLIYISISCISVWIQFSTIECGPALVAIKEKDTKSIVPTAADHVSNTTKREILSNNPVKSTPDNIDNKKTKRNSISKFKIFQQRFLPESFGDYQQGVDVNFVPLDLSSLLAKRKSDNNEIPRTTAKESLRTTSRSSLTTTYTAGIPTTGTAKKDQLLVQKHPEISHDSTKDRKPLAIHIEEKLEVTTTNSTVNITKLAADDENRIPIMLGMVLDPVLVPINIPFMSNIPKSGDEVNNNTLIDSQEHVERGKKESNPEIMKINEFAESTTWNENIEEDDEGDDLMRVGRQIIVRSGVVPSVNDTPPVSYEGTLVSTSDNPRGNNLCLMDGEISEIIFGPMMEKEKQEWLLENKNKICDYNKFQKCIEREKVTTTTDKDEDANGGEQELSKTYCGCITGDLILVGDTCYIPAGTRESSKCPVELGLPAGGPKNSPILRPRCTVNSLCSQRPEFYGYRCLCKPNIKQKKGSSTCGKAAHIFHPISQLLLILGTSGFIFAL